MRIVLVAETFLPVMNGVVNSVLRVADELAASGHSPIIVAPEGAPGHVTTRTGVVVPVHTVAAVAVPGYRGLRVARPGSDLVRLFAAVRPDVVHLASPVLLGDGAAAAARELGLPVVAVFQTDLARFLHRYRVGAASPLAWSWLRRVHRAAQRTLAPSTSTAHLLRARGIDNVHVWARGVDAAAFAPGHRSSKVRADLLGSGRLLVGAVGRLAAEKRFHLLADVSRLPGVQLVVVGDGPQRRRLERALPDAVFTGFRSGPALSRLMASFDILVNPGADETFCQVVQESLSSGVPVVAAASGGPLDLVRHRENGWLWCGDDPRVLAAMVADLQASPELVQVARRARRSVAARSWARVTDQLLDHYQAVIDPSAVDQPNLRAS